ncbi:DUF4097 family beta strand repeat-containing protein [Paenibacillus filicis]|uniref:DUF4097 family beta strand repeat-containing protein n=1 Tax=Paenibacillus filicis TaxID=669464 RepID=A0ABU9DWL1_9BACL
MQRSVGFILIAVGIIILIYMANPMRLFTGGSLIFNAQEINQEETMEAGNIRNLRIESSSAEIEVLQGGSDKIQARLNGKASTALAEQLKLKLEPQDDTLRIGIELPESAGLGLQKQNLELHVELPEKLMKSLVVETSSGDVRLNQVSADNIQLKATSGNLTLNQVNGEKISAQASSGDVEASGVQAASVDFHTASGNIEVSGYTANELKVQASSGEIKMRDGQAMVTGITESGGIRLEADELTRSIDLKASSGDVILAVSQEPKSLKLDYRSSSGEGKVKWDGFVYSIKQEEGRRIEGAFGTGDVKLNIRTSSGNFRLEKR